MKQESNDIKQLAALMMTYLSRSVDSAMPMPVLKALVPMLVNGTKEKNTLVRTNSEGALMSLLRLRQQNDTTYQVSHLAYCTYFGLSLLLGPFIPPEV